MATETSKRNPNSASKNRKSRNEIIRSSLGMYLKQRNYMVNKINKKSFSKNCSIEKFDVNKKKKKSFSDTHNNFIYIYNIALLCCLLRLSFKISKLMISKIILIFEFVVLQ